MLSVSSFYKDEITILGSKFIALIFPFDDENKADLAINEIKKEYPKADHYCYAYRIDDKDYCYDDGEPSHSAGFPILNSLKSEDLTHVLVIVIRYFGGTKLGLSRLKETYKYISKSVCQNAKKVNLIDGIKAKLSLDYSSFNFLKRKINEDEVTIKDPHYESKVTFFIEGSDKILSSLLNNYKEYIICSEKVLIKKEIKNDSSK